MTTLLKTSWQANYKPFIGCALFETGKAALVQGKSYPLEIQRIRVVTNTISFTVPPIFRCKSWRRFLQANHHWRIHR